MISMDGGAVYDGAVAGAGKWREIVRAVTALEPLWLPAWRAAVARLGAEATVGVAGSIYGARIDGVEVRVRSGTSSGVQLGAMAPGAGPLRLELRPGHVYPFARALGVRDLEVGDAPFDDRFVIKASDEGLARVWLDGPARAAALAVADHAQFHLRRERVVGFMQILYGLVSQDELEVRLAGAARAVAALASSGTRLGAAWRALGGTLGGRVVGAEHFGVGEGAMAIVAPWQGREVRIQAAFDWPDRRRWRRRSLFTWVRARRTAVARDAWAIARAGADFRPRRGWREAGRGDEGWSAWGTDAARVAARRRGPGGEWLGAGAPEVVVGDAEAVTAWVPGVLAGVERARALVALVGALADEVDAGASGPYR
jgi:hypothetical protein